MADSFHESVVDEATPAPSNPVADVDMAEVAADDEAQASANPNPNGSELPFAEMGPDDPPAPRITFLQYLTSPMVTLIVGHGDNETILTAHQGLLTQSPYFADACAEFTDDGSV